MDNQIVNHIAILLDRSGSMGAHADNVLKQYNQQAKDIQSKADETGQKTLLSLYTFSYEADQPILVECPLDLVSLKPLTRKTYNPTGQTAMLDSIGLAIEQLSKFERGSNDSFLVIVITDGEENNSYRYPAYGDGWSRISEIIKAKTATDMWTFAFLVPVGRKRSLLSRLAVYDGNVQEWDTTSARGVEQYTQATRGGLDNFFAARATGVRSTKGFFTDLKNVPRTAVVGSLQEVTADYVGKEVPSDMAIRDFCNLAFGSYRQGAAFYELTKREAVQAQKEFLIQHRYSGKIYGGDHARDLLGLPSGGEIKLNPGDHGDYKVFVQSTSVNRKLIKGTTVLYRR